MTATADEPLAGSGASGSQLGGAPRTLGHTQPHTSGTHVQAGRVGRAHGLDGSFYVTGARARLLTLGTALTLDGRATVIARRAGTDEHPIVRVDGIASRSAVEAVRGAQLTVDHADAPSLGEGEWWAGELEGCVVVDGERVVGVVVRLVELPSCEALEVRPDGGRGEARSEGVLLVPMVRDAIREVDVGARRIDVDMSFIEHV